MLEMIGGALVMLGGGMLTSSAVMLTQTHRRSAELVAVLSYTPLPPRNASLEQLMRDAGAALDART